MASYVTDEKGKWHPAKERVALKNYGPTFKDKRTGEVIETGMDYIYEGPCRAALFELWEANGKPTEEQMKENKELMTLGEGYRQNKEFLDSYSTARQAFGFNSVDEYLKYLGYDEVKIKADFEKKAAVVTKHDLPKRVAEIKKLGGGDNKANPGRDLRYGGFGEPQLDSK